MFLSNVNFTFLSKCNWNSSLHVFSLDCISDYFNIIYKFYIQNVKLCNIFSINEMKFLFKESMQMYPYFSSTLKNKWWPHLSKCTTLDLEGSAFTRNTPFWDVLKLKRYLNQFFSSFLILRPLRFGLWSSQ